MRPRVAICVPSLSTWDAQTGCALFSLGITSASTADLFIITTRHSLVSLARNTAVRRALAIGADFVLFVDADMVFPGDALNRLLGHNQDIVGVFLPDEAPAV